MLRNGVVALVALALCGLGGPAAAQMDSMQKAASLGSVLGAEKACRLQLNQKAVDAWIEKNVRADDMDFAGTLSLMTAGTVAEIKEMSPMQVAAHCTQTRRVARANKFID